MNAAPDWQDQLNKELERVPVESDGSDHSGAVDGSETAESAYSDEHRVRKTKRRDSQADEVVKFVCSHCELVHDENSNVYAIDRTTREVRHIDRRAFRDWLLAAYYSGTARAVRSQSLNEALQTLTGIGRHEGMQAEVCLRCAAVGSGYFIDLGEPGNSRAIHVEPGSWRIVQHAPVMFVRPDSLQALPEPVSGGEMGELWNLVNIPTEAQLLVLTWLMDCLRPDTPFPLLEFIGEQGSAKSVTQSILRKLIDPSATDLRSAPKNGEDVFVGAAGGWLLAYDNVSHLNPDLQDTLCRIATGATHATRKLYTNTEEATIRAKRPVSINGISAAITAQDLVDRTLSLELSPIEDRRERGEIEGTFQAGHARLLGALLDLFATALARLPGIKIARDRRPRLIEYATLGCAVAEALGISAEDFLTRFESVRTESISRTLDASPVAVALMDWLDTPNGRNGEYVVRELFRLLTRPEGTDSWPRSAKGFADALRRAAPALRTLGIEVRMLGKRGSHSRVWVAKRAPTEN